MFRNHDTSCSFAEHLDLKDPLAKYKTRFAFPDPNMIYLDGNSLGRETIATATRISQLSEEWSRDLIRGYNANWWQAPGRVGEKIARLIGAGPGQVVVSDTVSVNLFKLASAALGLNPARTKIVTDTLNFPSDLYILQGLSNMLGNRHSIVRIESKDGEVTPDLVDLEHAIDDSTALVTLSHVTFKSGYLYDMDQITRIAHDRGALVLWDLSHSVGAVPIGLDACNVDLAIGCTYKYLNGGPGAPAFLYVRKELQEMLTSPIWGWWGQKAPFSISMDYEPASGITRFLTGSQPILSLIAMENALDPLVEAGMIDIRKKSLLLSYYLISLADEFLIPLGFILATPRESDRRGSHVSLRHPDGYRINKALIEEMNVIPDFREPDNLRLGLAPLYTSFGDIWNGIDRIRLMVEEKKFEKYSDQRLTVT